LAKLVFLDFHKSIQVALVDLVHIQLVDLVLVPEHHAVNLFVAAGLGHDDGVTIPGRVGIMGVTSTISSPAHLVYNARPSIFPVIPLPWPKNSTSRPTAAR